MHFEWFISSVDQIKFTDFFIKTYVSTDLSHDFWERMKKRDGQSSNEKIKELISHTSTLTLGNGKNVTMKNWKTCFNDWIQLEKLQKENKNIPETLEEMTVCH